MRGAAEQELWIAAGVNAIQCLIAAADAVLVYRRGIRSVAQDHMEAAALLGSEKGLPDIDRAVAHFRRALGKKNLAEYEDRELSAKEGHELVEHAQRFCDWAASHVLPAIEQ